MESAVLTGQDVEPIAWSEARDRLANERFCWLATDKYGWPVVVEGGAFQAPYGAPTAGPPPYLVYEIRPVQVFGFGTDDALGPRTTRWRF